MSDLSKLSDRAKVWFLQAALLDAADELRKYDPDTAKRYSGYVMEIEGKQQNQEASHG